MFDFAQPLTLCCSKNYRKPLLQRYVVRILVMVPIYSIASFTSMVSLTAASFLDPIRDIYEVRTAKY